MASEDLPGEARANESAAWFLSLSLHEQHTWLESTQDVDPATAMLLITAPWRQVDPAVREWFMRNARKVGYRALAGHLAGSAQQPARPST
jgi:hypothetical protein